MKPIYSLIIICILLHQNVIPQPANRKKHSIVLTTGVTSYSVKDRLATPLTYNGIDLPIGLSYHYKTMKNYHRIFIRYSKTKLESSIASYQEHYADYYSGTVQYGYLRFLSKIFDNKMNIYGGAVWDNFIAVRIYNFNKYNGEATGEIFSSLSVAVFGEYPFRSKTNMNISFFSPVFSYVLRSPYSLKDELLLKAIINNDSPFLSLLKLGKFKSFDKLLSCTTSLSVIHQLSPLLDLTMSWQFIYYSYREPKTITGVSITYGVGLIFNF